MASDPSGRDSPARIEVGGQRATFTEPGTVYVQDEHDFILIGVDRLWKDLTLYERSVNKSRGWHVWFGIAITIGITLVTADFKAMFGVSSELWFALFLVTGAIATWLLLASLFSFCVTWMKSELPTVDHLIDRIKRHGRPMRGQPPIESAGGERG